MPYFENHILITTGDFDSTDQLKPEVILRYFEEIATTHVQQYGVGQYDLIQQGMLWVVTQTKVVYVKPIRGKQNLCLRTWSLPPRHAMVQREYQMVDESGDVCVIGASQWVLMDMNTRKATLKMSEVLRDFDFESTSNFEKRPRFLRAFSPQGEGMCITPDDSSIDFNDHVNNGCYAAYMMAALPESLSPIVSFTIDYRKEMRLGESLQVYTNRTEKGWQTEGFSTEDEVLVFVGEVITDNESV